MPGVSSRQPVKGEWGVGKIHLKFSKKKPKKYFGAIVFLFSSFSVFFCFLWSKPGLRYEYAVPGMRTVLNIIDFTIRNIQHPSKEAFLGISSMITGSDLQNVIKNQGYDHALKNLAIMEFNRMLASGQLSRILGNEYVKVDKLARYLNFRGLALKDLELQNELELQILASYTSGINKYINETMVLPLELLSMGVTKVTLWGPVDTLMLLKLRSYLSTTSKWEDQIVMLAINASLGTKMTSKFQDLLKLNLDSLDTAPYDLRSIGGSFLAFRNAGNVYLSMDIHSDVSVYI